MIDTATNTVVDEVTVGRSPNNIAITSDGTHAYVTNLNSASLSVIDAVSNTVVDTVTGILSPYGVAITPGAMQPLQGSDGDGILDDGDGSGTVGDNKCTGGQTANCDDNCLNDPNPDQSDVDGDGVGDACDSSLPPTANAGPDQALRAGTLVQLDGSNSFDDNTASNELDYHWSWVSKPVDSEATLFSFYTSTPNFFADVIGTYTVQLVVTDQDGNSSAPDTVELSTENIAPVAVAWAIPPLALVYGTVTLDGTGSTDPEGDPLTYQWNITSRPIGSAAAVTDNGNATASLLLDIEGLYTITLTVSDAIGPGAPATVEVTAASAATYAQARVISAGIIISELPTSQVMTIGNQQALINFLSQMLMATEAGDMDKARDKLTKTIERVDGCELRGAPDGNGPGMDWITNCSAQTEVYRLLFLARKRGEARCSFTSSRL